MATQERLGLASYNARARSAKVRIETEDGVYVGQVFVPETKKRLSDVLCDDRAFLNMTEVTINDSQVVEPFVALNKRYVKAVRVLQEGGAEVVSIGHRH
jgi:hypothetical protein